MERTFIRTITIEVTYNDPYKSDQNAWDAMHEYSPDEMITEAKNEMLSDFFKNTNYILLDDEWKFEPNSPQITQWDVAENGGYTFELEYHHNISYVTRHNDGTYTHVYPITTDTKSESLREIAVASYMATHSEWFTK
jgi:hypothetical protein